MNNNLSSVARSSSREKYFTARELFANNYYLRNLLLCIGFLIIILCVLLFNSIPLTARNSSDRTLCYKQILINEGDSLWSIAKENYTEEWKNMKSYVNTIKEFNNLNTYHIYAGSHLSIPYYTFVEE